MTYEFAVFGVKDTTESIIRFIHDNIRPVSLIVTVDESVTKKNEISGYMSLDALADELGIGIFKAKSYALSDPETASFFSQNKFSLGLSMGWQRLVPPAVLDAFPYGLYGFHGNCGYLPFGRGRSPLNWSLLLGDTRFNLNLFRYDEKADSPNVFGTEMFSLTPFDDIRTAQCKNTICSKRLITRLLAAYAQAVETGGEIPVRTSSKDFDSWYGKRTSKDGEIDFRQRTREIHNLIRAVSAPFPGAFAYIGETKVTIWKAVPFDEMIDFSSYAPGEVIDVYDDMPIVRTVDGSLLIERYESENPIVAGDVFEIMGERGLDPLNIKKCDRSGGKHNVDMEAAD